MRKILAVCYKDFCLFVGGSGWLILILPFVLLFALRAGLGEGTGETYVRPFPVAVRDLDDTVMSRSLMAQMSEVELFCEVHKAKEETDQELLAEGMAAVVTIPEDFFYDLYTMEDCPVEVILNEEMKLESALFRSIFCSVMDIIWANQAAERGIFRFCYGEAGSSYEDEMYEEASKQLLQDALGRQAAFASEPSTADLTGALGRRLTAALLAAVALLFSAEALKTLPKEREGMTLPRYQALGGSPLAFIASKCLLTLVLFLAVAVPILRGLLPAGGGAPLLAALCILAGAFGPLLAAAAWKDGGTVQYISNLLLLGSLALGGCLWPANQLPPVLRALSRLTLPYYGRMGLELAARGAGTAELLKEMRPVLLTAVLGGGIALAGFLRPGGRKRERIAGYGGADPEKTGTKGGEFVGFAGGEPAAGQESVRPSGRLLSRICGMAFLKGKAMIRGAGGLLTLLLLVFACGAAVSAGKGTAPKLSLAVCDLDQSALSQELTERLAKAEGVSTAAYSVEEGRQSLLRGEAEGLLILGEGYGQAMEAGEDLPLFYESASASLSGRGIREIVAGQAAIQRSRTRAVEKAGERLGHALSAEETQNLLEEITRSEGAVSSLYRIRTGSGRPPEEPFVPGLLSLAALAVLFTLLATASWCGRADARLAEKRMYSLRFGKTLSYGSDLLALFGIGLLVGAAVLVSGGRPDVTAWAAMAGYAFCSAGLCLALVRLMAKEGRVDGLGPFLALALCLLGGCFIDLAQASPGLARLAAWTMPGQMLAAGKGSWQALGILLAEGAAFAAAGAPRRAG